MTGFPAGSIRLRMETVTVADVMGALGAVAPIRGAADWDPVGLQIGDGNAAVARLAVCHDVTDAVVDRAERDGVEMLVAYHPLVFRPLRRLVAGSGPGGRAWRLARAGVALAVVHTAFDVAPGGAADALAEALQVEDPLGFAPAGAAGGVKIVTFLPAEAADEVVGAMTTAGAGRIGGYTGCSFRGDGVGTFQAPADATPAVGRAGEANREPEVRLEMVCDAAARGPAIAALVAAHPYEHPAFDVFERTGDPGMLGRVGRWQGPLEELAELAGDVLGPAVRVAGEPQDTIESVAVVPGSGGDLVEAARAAGADALVTGDVGHHAARGALEAGLAIVDPGHAATERPGVARLYSAVSRIVDDVVDLTGLDADPWGV